MREPLPPLQPQQLDLGQLFEALQEGLQLVTANSRLARVLMGRYNEWRLTGGNTQWETPSISPWEAWLDRLWDGAALAGAEGSDRAVPGKRQTVSLWESVLRRDALAGDLLQATSLAALLADTRRLVVEWRVDPRNPAWRGDGNENHAAFSRWNRAFEAACREDGWLPPEDRPARLADAIRGGVLQVEGSLGLLGFDELNPAQSELIMALADRGTTLRAIVLEAAPAAAQLWRARDVRHELRAMARWVRLRLEQQPAASIAVVVPDLAARRDAIDRELADILAPGRPAESTMRPWNLSLGEPLAQAPLVEAAFDLLGLLEPEVDIQLVGRVLRSPWISAGASERSRRAMLELCLRERYPRRLRLGEVLYRAREVQRFDDQGRQLPEQRQTARAWNCPVLAEVLSKLSGFARGQQGSRKPSAWAEAFAGLLGALGWPNDGDREDPLAGAEADRHWQAYRAWQEALRELASLDATIRTLQRSEAVAQLRQICSERIFQPRTPPAPVQILGLYEASGMRFDHLWVLGLHGDNWPPAARPNPFIPGVLQRAAGLPHSSPDRELAVARTVTERLLQSAEEVIFSYPGTIDGERVPLSPLLDRPEMTPADRLPGWEGRGWRATMADSEPPTTDCLDMPRSLPAGAVRGGSSILKYQALCPFRAFAAHRLGAERPETPVEGISAKLHGSLVHRVLESFWEEIRDQKTLLELDDDALESALQNHIDRVLETQRDFRFRPALSAIESGRIRQHLLAQLMLEKVRGPFKAVELEKPVSTVVGGHEISLKIDRIDVLPDGRKVIIDYKTGQVDPKHWFGERPEDPQLPLYASCLEAAGELAGVAFAVIRADGSRFRGVVSAEGIFPELPPKLTAATAELVEAGQNLAQTAADWQRVLHRLMGAFLAGDATIDPKDGRRTCAKHFCEFQPLCRIDELELTGNRDEPGATPERVP